MRQISRGARKDSWQGPHSLFGAVVDFLCFPVAFARPVPVAEGWSMDHCTEDSGKNMEGQP